MVHARSMITAVLREAVLPLAVFCGLAWMLTRQLGGSLASRVIGGGTSLTPSDINGTLWFYWWTRRALTQGADLLTPDVICAPTGQFLGSNFPQHIDAMMAVPFLSAFDHPVGFNVFILAVPVFGALAAFGASRILGLRVGPALMVGALFGFNALSIHELANGKPASAMVLTLPLFIATWLMCLRTPGRRVWPWVISAGFAGAIAIQHYVLYALLAAIFAVGSMVVHMLRPPPRMAPIRAVVLGVVVALCALALSAPYLKQLLQERRPMPTAAQTLTLQSPAVLAEQRESIDIAYPIAVDRRETLPRRAAFPTILTILGVLLLPVSGRRGRRWIGAAVGFYLLSLGPIAAIAVRPEIEWLTISGRVLPMPTWWLNRWFPFSIQFFHPCRVFPMVVLLAAIGVGFSMQRLGERWGRRLHRWIPLASIVVGGVGLVQVQHAGGLTLLSAPHTPHPFVEKLAAEPGDFAIIEFPVGLGHATAPAQLIHNKRRSASHHDQIAALRANQPPDDCLQLPLLQALWDLSRGSDPTRAGPDTEGWFARTTPAAIDQAHRAGFRYLIAWRSGFDTLVQAGISVDRHNALLALRNRLGPPIYADETLEAYALAPSDQP